VAKDLGLKNLFIIFSGYWPERNVCMRTCSFKDLESPPTVQRLQEKGEGSTPVVASAGRSACAFAEICSLTGHPLPLFKQEKALPRIRTMRKGNLCGGSDVSSADFHS
jgi:cysteate synthase